MISRGTALIPALVVCALSICAFAAANASAAELTAVTCSEVAAGTGKYSTSHCATPQVPGNFETVALSKNETTEVKAESTGVEPALRSTVAGSGMTVKCEKNSLSGASITNREPSAGKHTVETTVKGNTYTGCKAVLKANEARSCLVEGTAGVGKISTNELKSTTTGVNHQVKVSPKEGEVFVKFTILNKAKGGVECFFAADVAVEVKGSVEGEANTTTHSHLTFTEANNGTFLKANGGSANYLDTVSARMVGTEITVGAETFT